VNPSTKTLPAVRAEEEKVLDKQARHCNSLFEGTVISLIL
jgi:hypothetical protein